MNLQALLEHRRNGQRPVGLVFLTLVPELRKFIPSAVNVPPHDDVRALIGLDVCLAFHSSQIEAAFLVADAALACMPNTLIFWGLDSGRLTHLIENGDRAITWAAPDFAMSPIVEAIKCN